MDFTVQESFLLGGSEAFDDVKPNRPVYLDLGSSRYSIKELNEQRASKRYFRPYIARKILNNNDVVLSLEPLNEKGETERIPQVLILNRETNELAHSPELTEEFYRKLRQDVLNSRLEDAIQIVESFFQNEGTSKEHEVNNPPEGMRNV